LKYQTKIFKLKKKNLKKGNNSLTGNQIYFKTAGHVDLDKLNMFAVYT
jgi:hypothetical protein